MKVVRKGVFVLAVRYRSIRADSPRSGRKGILKLGRDGLSSVTASYWNVANVQVGDEIAVFDRDGEKGKPAIATGDVESVSGFEPDDGCSCATIWFTLTNQLIHRADVMLGRNPRYYEVLSDGTRRPKKSN